MRGGRWGARLIAIAVGVALCSPCCAAEDGGGGRYYVNLRYGGSWPFSRAHDESGVSIGANLTRYLGAELAIDHYDLMLTLPGVGKITELGTVAVMPQVRLRYPLLHDRLVPYLIGGAGAAFAQVNDRTVRALGRAIESDDVAFMGAMGGGLEYFMADNFAVGLDARYLISSSAETTVAGTRVNSNLDAALLGFALRFLYPSLHPDDDPGSGYRGTSSVYLTLLGGGATPVQHHVFGQIVEHEQNAAYGNLFDQLYGIGFGVNLGPHLGLELPFEGYEMALGLPGVGTIGEYALYVVIPQIRARFPILEGRLEPYATAGVGPTYTEFNDRRPITKSLGTIRSDGFGFGAILGVGLEYYVAKNIAIGCQARYLFDRSHELTVEETDHPGNLDSVFVNLTLRVMLFESHTRLPEWLAR
jgi:opacity protein-like surface antigen